MTITSLQKVPASCATFLSGNSSAIPGTTLSNFKVGVPTPALVNTRTVEEFFSCEIRLEGEVLGVIDLQRSGAQLTTIRIDITYVSSAEYKSESKLREVGSRLLNLLLRLSIKYDLDFMPRRCITQLNSSTSSRVSLFVDINRSPSALIGSIGSPSRQAVWIKQWLIEEHGNLAKLHKVTIDAVTSCISLPTKTGGSVVADSSGTNSTLAGTDFISVHGRITSGSSPVSKGLQQLLTLQFLTNNGDIWDIDSLLKRGSVEDVYRINYFVLGKAELDMKVLQKYVHKHLAKEVFNETYAFNF